MDTQNIYHGWYSKKHNAWHNGLPSQGPAHCHSQTVKSALNNKKSESHSWQFYTWLLTIPEPSWNMKSWKRQSRMNSWFMHDHSKKLILHQGSGMKTCTRNRPCGISDFSKNQLLNLRPDLAHTWPFPEDWRCQNWNLRTFFSGCRIII